MVVGVFPIAKLGGLLIKQISKPVANFVKERAKQNYFFRTYVCMPPAQFYNWCEIRVKMWMLNMGKPDSIPQLNEQMAIELGANLLGETIVFVSAATIILMEYVRQARKEMTKEAARLEEIDSINNKIRDLSFQLESQDTHIRRLMHMIAELESNAIKIPWKGPMKHSKDDKHEFKVTKEEASSFISKSKNNSVKKESEKNR
ncbi:hypothetical protein PGB90_002222 [Kerria lacca]